MALTPDEARRICESVGLDVETYRHTDEVLIDEAGDAGAADVISAALIVLRVQNLKPVRNPAYARALCLDLERLLWHWIQNGATESGALEIATRTRNELNGLPPMEGTRLGPGGTS